MDIAVEEGIQVGEMPPAGGFLPLAAVLMMIQARR